MGDYAIDAKMGAFTMLLCDGCYASGLPYKESRIG